MIFRSLLSIALIGSLAFLLQARAEDGPASAHSEIDVQMEEINVAYRRLGRQISDQSKNANSVQQAAVIQKYAKAAMELEPRMMADLPKAEQAKFLEAYRARMATFIDDVAKLEAALKSDKNAEAAEILGRLKQAQEEGHKEFRPKRMTFEEKAAEAARRSEEFNEQLKNDARREAAEKK